MDNTVRHRLPLPRAIAPTLAAATAAALSLASPSTARADNDLFSVPAGTTYTVETSATHGTNDIRGTLVLPSGKTFGAERN